MEISPCLELGAYNPMPDPHIDKVRWINEDGFTLYIGGISREGYAKHADSKAAAGFDRMLSP